MAALAAKGKGRKERRGKKCGPESESAGADEWPPQSVTHNLFTNSAKGRDGNGRRRHRCNQSEKERKAEFDAMHGSRLLFREALIVGEGLAIAHNDAQDVAEVVRKSGGEVRLSVGNSACSSANVSTGLQWLSEDEECEGPVLVYISSHGELRRDRLASSNDDGMGMRDLRTRVLQLPCEEVFLVLDCCGSGAILAPQARRGHIANKKKNKGKRVILASSAHGERSYGWESLRNSQVTGLLLRALGARAADYFGGYFSELISFPERWSRTTAHGLGEAVLKDHGEIWRVEMGWHDEHPAMEVLGEDFAIFEGTEAVEVRQIGSDVDTDQIYRGRLMAFYQHYAEDKVNQVDVLLSKLKPGREEELFRMLVRKYGPEPGTENVTGTLQHSHAAAPKSEREQNFETHYRSV